MLSKLPRWQEKHWEISQYHKSWLCRCSPYFQASFRDETEATEAAGGRRRCVVVVRPQHLHNHLQAKRKAAAAVEQAAEKLFPSTPIPAASFNKKGFHLLRGFASVETQAWPGTFNTIITTNPDLSYTEI